ncbi:phosphonate metabolism transcriptional regulator PhnF [Microvirgula curvata]
MSGTPVLAKRASTAQDAVVSLLTGDPMTDAPVTRRTGTPVWRQIEATLAAEILAGRLTGRLANETGLAERFGVNRHTVRQATRALAERGLVEVLHGRGTFVREDMIDYEVGRRTRFAHSVAKARRVGRSRITGYCDMAPDATVVEMLSLADGTRVVRVDSLDVVDDKVIGVCVQYFPLPRFHGIAEIYCETGKTHLALARFGVDEFHRRVSRVTARLPDKDVARQLNQSVSMPILCVETVYEDASGCPIEYGISHFGSTTVQVVIEP